MASSRVSRREKNADRGREAAPQLESDPGNAPAPVVRVAEFSSPEDFRAAALAAAPAGDLTLDLASVDYLDASSLQILLAIHAEQKNSERHLHLVHASPALLQWLEWTGAAQHLPEARSPEARLAAQP